MNNLHKIKEQTESRIEKKPEEKSTSVPLSTTITTTSAITSMPAMVNPIATSSMQTEIKPLKQQLKTSQIYRESPIIEPELAPDFEKKLENIIALEGNKVTFECLVSGSAPLDIKWLKNGSELINSSNTIINHTPSNGMCTLTLNEVTTNDNAMYSCKANNQQGMCETSAYLKVKGN
jgi:hypothetical protein